MNMKQSVFPIPHSLYIHPTQKDFVVEDTLFK